MRRNVRIAASAFTLMAVAAPAWADDAATKGILAGAGLAAASGKTSLGAGAGAMEAGLLDSEAFQQAGQIIASVVNAHSNGRPVLVLAHDQNIDLIMSKVIQDRMIELAQLVKDSCSLPAPPSPAPVIDGMTLFLKGLKADNTRFQGSDLVTVGATETAINALALTAEDRLLINALIMNGNAKAPIVLNAATVWQPQATGTGLSTSYRIPGEPVGYYAKSEVLKAYKEFQKTLTQQRLICKSAEGKAAIGVADAFATGLNTASDKGPAPLATALQLESMIAGQPLALRVAIEQIGGTAITTSGLLYTFGWPNAATVSAGIKVSFRLIDPSAASGKMKAVGEVRCLVRQTNVKRVIDVIGGKQPGKSATQPYPLGDTVCDYRVAT